jgi:hypothetical protein
MFTTRYPWGVTTGLLCALLLQNCQSQLNALEEELPAEAPPQSGWQPPASEALTQPLSYAPSPPPTTATYQPKVPPTVPSLSLPPGVSLPTTFAGTSPSMGIHPTASITPSPNILTQDSYGPLTASSGELVKFKRYGDGQWQAVVPFSPSSYTPQRTLPVVSAEDMHPLLTWLEGQDRWTSRARIHVLNTSQPPYRSCVYVGKHGLLGGMQQDAQDEQEDGRSLLMRSQDSTATGPKEEWIQGPRMTLTSNGNDRQIFHIPEGLLYRNYRIVKRVVSSRASWGVTYVGAGSKDVVTKTAKTDSLNEAKISASAEVASIVPLGKFGGNLKEHRLDEQNNRDFSTHTHSGIVLYGRTKKNWLCQKESRLEVVVEICVVQKDVPSASENAAMESTSHPSGVASASNRPPIVAENSDDKGEQGGEETSSKTEDARASVQVGGVGINACGGTQIGYVVGNATFNNLLPDEKKK